MSKESMTFKQKKGSKNGRNKYLKPGGLAQLRYSRTATRSCKVIGKKRVTSDSEKKVDLLKAEAAVLSTIPAVSPTPTRMDFRFTAGAGDGSKALGMPKTPQAEHCDSQSRLESLPFELLVKILCHLHHDQLRASFHVSQRIRTAYVAQIKVHKLRGSQGGVVELVEGSQGRVGSPPRRESHRRSPQQALQDVVRLGIAQGPHPLYKPVKGRIVP